MPFLRLLPAPNLLNPFQKSVVRVPRFNLCILFAALVLPACTASPITGPTTTPTAHCINAAWSYSENTITEIETSPDLMITLREQTADLDTQEIFESQTVIHGDGRVFYDRRSIGAGAEGAHIEKHITADQLKQIVDVFVAANFFAISPGCNGRTIYVMDVDTLDIAIETKDGIHTIQDNGTCAEPVKAGFAKYCELAGQVQTILGPWEP